MIVKLNRFVALTSAMLIVVAGVGCGLIFPSLDPRLTDGGGGTLISALDKVAQGNLSGLTQDELQLLSDQINQAIQSANPGAPVNPLTNEQASAILEFLAANNLNSPEDFDAFSMQAEMDPDSVVIPPSLITAFSGDAPFADPDNPTPEEIEALLGMVFTM